MNNFEKFVMAHLIADFLLQNNWMALNKSKSFGPLITHTFLYMTCMACAFPTIGYALIPITFFHMIVDKFSLGDLWLTLIGGRSFKSILNKLPFDADSHNVRVKDVNNYTIYVSFTAVVYVVVDFLIHFLTTYPIIYYVLGA